MKISRKSRCKKKVIKPDKPVKPEIIKSIYLTKDYTTKKPFEDALMLIFKQKEKEISFEKDNESNSKIKIKFHNFTKSGYPKVNTYTFKDLAKLLFDGKN